mmetsp:Transcript_85036/g.264189  ORF Transcript_85036/g.264189 Transcript_85036/m.264189 type:complete len:212 (+) Transcript_85036:1094-1729(+)
MSRPPTPGMALLPRQAQQFATFSALLQFVMPVHTSLPSSSSRSTQPNSPVSARPLHPGTSSLYIATSFWMSPNERPTRLPSSSVWPTLAVMVLRCLGSLEKVCGPYCMMLSMSYFTPVSTPSSILNMLSQSGLMFSQWTWTYLSRSRRICSLPMPRACPSSCTAVPRKRQPSPRFSIWKSLPMKPKFDQQPPPAASLCTTIAGLSEQVQLS